MEYRKLGHSDLELSVISFGAWAAGGWMWGGTERKEAIHAMLAAYDLGVTSIDTAPIYGQGTSEEIVGAAIKNLQRDKVQVLTKYGLRWDLARGTHYFDSHKNDGTPISIYKYAGRESIIEECEQSLRRLGTDYIDLLQIHWPDVTTPIAESMEAVQRLMEQGKVRHAGVCNYSKEQVQEAQQSIPLVSDQVPYNMLRRGIEKELLPYCIDNNISILAYSPLERGLLTGKMRPGHRFAEGDHRATVYFFNDDNLARTETFLKKIKPIAEEKKITVSQLVLRWTLDQPGITVALAGARDARQATENAKAADVMLSKEEMDLINSELSSLELVKPTV